MIKNSATNTLFLGHGYVSQFFCATIDHSMMNVGVSINNTKDNYFTTPADVETINFATINEKILDLYDHFVISIPPFYALKTDIIIEKFHPYFLKRTLPFTLIYLSATSVYGDHNGEKVQENSELRSQSVNGMARIACEKKYNTLKDNQCANIIILRLAAIYGDRRNSILSIIDKKITANTPSTRVISRTHVLDISNIIKQLLLSKTISNITLNIADNNPSTSKEVYDYICDQLLKIKRLPISDQATTVKNTSFVLDNKIIDNALLKKTLNYNFIFPSYKEGLQSIIESSVNDAAMKGWREK